MFTSYWQNGAKEEEIRFFQRRIKLLRSPNPGSSLLKRLDLLSGSFVSDSHYEELINSENIILDITQEEKDLSRIGDEKDYTCALSNEVTGSVCWTGKLQAYFLFIHCIVREAKFTKESLQKIPERKPRVSVVVSFVEKNVYCDVYLESNAFTMNKPDAAENLGNLYSCRTRGDHTLKPILQYFYTLKDNDMLYMNNTYVRRKSVEDLYDFVMSYHGNNKYHCIENENFHDLCFSLQHENLMPSLRTYQAKAVNWMIYKENESIDVHDKELLHPFWEEIATDGGEILFVNTFNGDIQKTPPIHEDLVFPKGGILADEMGLGKTVEILALVLNNQKVERFKVKLAKQDTPQKDNNLRLVERELSKKPLSFESHEKRNVETFLPDLEMKVNHANGNVVAKYSFKRKSQSTDMLPLSKKKTNDEILVEGTGVVRMRIYPNLGYSVNTAEKEFKSISSPENGVFCFTETEVYSSNDNQYMRETSTEDRLHTKSLNQEDDCNELSGNGSQDIHYDETTYNSDEDPCYLQTSKYQKSSYPPKIKFSKTKCLKDVCNDHTYISSNYEEVSYHLACCICGDNARDKDDITKITCADCKENVMHRECAGYTQNNVHCYECPNCAVKQLTESHCTLIICPDTLLTQWVTEIEKHIKRSSMKFLVYKGVKVHSFLQPKMLAEYDLIVTSFSTLRLDFNYVVASDQKLRKSLRHRRKYVILPCPLLAINFWRVCIDEAQMVETDSTKLAEMCQRLNSVNRWCVTGTPLQKSVEDLYGLYLFLSVRPYSHRGWFQRALLLPFMAGNHVPLFELTSKLMWRNSKMNVEKELCLPKQTEYLTWLQFSAVEQHFYQKQLDSSADRTARSLDKDFSYLNEGLKLSDLNKSTLSKLLSPLLTLRQACNHPAVVRNSYIPMEKKCLTMDQLLDKLTASSKTESEEAHRKLLCALNGLAGVKVLQNNFEEAVTIYQNVIKSWNEYAHLKTDSLQKLHTLHNLHEIVMEHQLDIPNEEKLKEIAEETKKIRLGYLSLINKNVTSNETLFASTLEELSTVKNKVDFESPWWLAVLAIINESTQKDDKDDLLTRIFDELSVCSNVNSPVSLHGRFRSLTGLQLLLDQHLKKIEEQRTLVHESLHMIESQPSKRDVQETAECCLRPVEDLRAPRCTYCEVERVINNYERIIYSHQGHNRLTESGSSMSTGFRSETEVDRVLKILKTFAKNYGINETLISQGKDHLKYQELMKKEFKSIRALYMAYHQRVQALDELDMCTMRLRLQLPGETDVESKAYIIKPLELQTTKFAFESEKLLAENELKRKEHQLLYLQNLAKVQTEHDGYNPETCPICVSQFGAEWAVFKCGHCFCCKCIVELQKRSYAYVANSTTHMRCPLCRAVTKCQEISFVVTRLKKPQGFDAHVAIKGQYSTKVEAVLRRILWIREQNINDKIIIFSTWTHVLSLISSALFSNNVLYKLCDGNKKTFQTSLTTFKQSSHINVLLLPLHAGSKGLNIIEATHVVIVEPALNPADELQAVGRVHRIGQTKETFVHRFLIKGTVEERMYGLLKTKTQQEKQQYSKPELTVGDLSCLFT